MRGGLTWISVDALLKACASVTTTYAVNEYFSSQKCAFCTHFVQRKGDYKDGFGEGNFKALFESMERDQIERGALKVEEDA